MEFIFFSFSGAVLVVIITTHLSTVQVSLLSISLISICFTWIICLNPICRPNSFLVSFTSLPHFIQIISFFSFVFFPSIFQINLSFKLEYSSVHVIHTVSFDFSLPCLNLSFVIVINFLVDLPSQIDHFFCFIFLNLHLSLSFKSSNSFYKEISQCQLIAAAVTMFVSRYGRVVCPYSHSDIQNHRIIIFLL
ncbi:OLFR [Acanthosepion pharaonis]|uniref:OLFR n=1 Tax=Acanthosepion pharaonis TaxID=158019 RepID=A0A812B0T9_ACAPH|nr:OLFR [Sepia pharaonis]